jgi:hypothetical protein
MCIFFLLLPPSIKGIYWQAAWNGPAAYWSCGYGFVTASPLRYILGMCEQAASLQQTPALDGIETEINYVQTET